MLENAIAKIKTEMEQNQNNSYIQVVGAYLLQCLNTIPEAAEKIMNADKTIAKSLDEMRKEAEKKKSENCAVLTDQEGFSIVLKYFDIDTKSAQNVINNTQNVIETNKTITNNTDFDIKLEDLI